MEKISGIIRGNSRTRKTDTSGSQPIRPGAPTFGRPEGRVTRNEMSVKDEVSFSPEARQLADTEKVDIAKEVSNKFALKKTVDEINDRTLSEQMADSSQSAEAFQDTAPL